MSTIDLAFRKWHVAELSGDAAWELHTLRGALEGLGARLAAERIDAAGKAQLGAAYQDLVETARRGERAAVTEADFRLHQLA